MLSFYIFEVLFLWGLLFFAACDIDSVVILVASSVRCLPSISIICNFPSRGVDKIIFWQDSSRDVLNFIVYLSYFFLDVSMGGVWELL